MSVAAEGVCVRDTFWNGRVSLWQPARGHGYRFNLDPVLLVGFASRAGHVVDLGAGCGIVGLLMLLSGKASRLTAVEIQPHLARMVARNAVENHVAERVTVLAGDLRRVALPVADAVVFNPPYFRAEQGRASPQAGRDAGRRECYGTLADFVTRARSCLRPGGRLAAIVPVARSADLATALAAGGFAVARRRYVCSRRGEAPRHVLAEAILDAADCAQLPDWVVHQGVGRDFTAETAQWVRGPAIEP